MLIHFSQIVWNESRNQFVTLCIRGHTCISKIGIQICSRILKPKSLDLDIRVRLFLTDHPKWGPNSIRHFVHLGPHLHLQNGYPNMLSDIKTENFSPIFLVCSFFTYHPKWVPKSICHFVHAGPRLHLQNGYPNMLSDFQTDKFSPRYPRVLIFHGSSELRPEVNSSLSSSGATLASPKWVSKYALRFQNRKV